MTAIAAVGLIVVFGLASCAQSDALVATDTGGPPSFTPTPDGGDSGSLPSAPLACVGTVCPEGLGTCLSGPVGAATYKCGTDLMSDRDNCGACGNKCGDYIPLHMTSRCVDGGCELQCYSPVVPFEPNDWRNCNGKIADGCEIDVLHDNANCGSCGNACPDGVSCIGGKCGCPPGWLECNGGCVDPKNNDYHCGSCNHACSANAAPGQCATPPPNTSYHCREGACGNLRCNEGWIDCNDDISTLGCASDGCEAPAGPENCGACGKKCGKDEVCITEGDESYCGIPCVKDKKVLCEDECVDLLNDVDACGACGISCPSPGPHGKRTCTKGVCGSECADGWADCNGDPSDGCEVDLRMNPDHCGACGTRCDVGAGQPCIDGKCLMVDCDYPGAK
ncbi:MAG: hypothetical protein BGO98_24490 [Myxococcales bacterium 68-20]|nr:MAG: hypothetical protein BGO98_24490 [Myxococcales bacterium 68-20]